MKYRDALRTIKKYYRSDNLLIGAASYRKKARPQADADKKISDDTPAE